MHVRVYRSSMSFRFGFFALALVVSGCDPAPNEPPPQTPKAAHPPDKTEVTMEVSSAAPPGAPPPPAPTPEASNGPDPSEDPNIGGAQADASVEKALAPLRPRLRVCYKKALTANPNIGSGSATFDATIGGKDGRVASVRFVKREGLDEDMVGCLLVVIKAMTFDASRKSQILTLTFGKPSATAADAGTKS
jgi:hypothetical protein